MRNGGRLLLMVTLAMTLLWVQQHDLGQFYSHAQTRLWNSYQDWGVAWLAEDPHVIVVQIDGQSINYVQKTFGEEWPWSRKRYADLLRLLFEKYQADVVGMDIFMPYTRDQQGNTELLDIARQHKLVLAEIFDLNGGEQAFSTGQVGGGIPLTDKTAEKLFPRANGYIGITPQLANVACLGHITPIQDNSNGLITKVPPLIAWQGRLYPMLALEMLRCQAGTPYDWSLVPQANGWELQLRGLLGEGSQTRLVLDEQGLLRVPYRYPVRNDKTHKEITAIPVMDIFQNKIPADLLQGGMVLIAGTATGLGDQQATPLEYNVPGVSVHVQLLEWLLSERENAPSFSLDKWSWGIGFVSLALLYLLLTLRIGAGTVTTITVVLLGTWLGLGFWVWVNKQWFLPMHPAVLLLFFLILQVPLEWWLAQHTSGRLQRLFADYLPTPLIKHLVDDNREDLLRPTRRCLTILFADIANFTQRAEHTDPEILATLTQQLLERLTAVSHKYAGTVDKYMGDAVLVFWNAPFTQVDHADRAVQAAVEMIQAIEQFNAEENSLLQGEPVSVRVGVHTGEVIVGNLGTRFRHAYTVIGDAVNVAARLQALARELQEKLVISQQTVELLHKTWPLVSKGKIALKGRQEPVSVYALVHKEDG